MRTLMMLAFLAVASHATAGLRCASRNGELKVSVNAAPAATAGDSIPVAWSSAISCGASVKALTPAQQRQIVSRRWNVLVVAPSGATQIVKVVRGAAAVTAPLSQGTNTVCVVPRPSQQCDGTVVPVGTLPTTCGLRRVRARRLGLTGLSVNCARVVVAAGVIPPTTTTTTPGATTTTVTATTVPPTTTTTTIPPATTGFLDTGLVIKQADGTVVPVVGGQALLPRGSVAGQSGTDLRLEVLSSRPLASRGVIFVTDANGNLFASRYVDPDLTVGRLSNPNDTSSPLIPDSTINLMNLPTRGGFMYAELQPVGSAVSIRTPNPAIEFDTVTVPNGTTTISGVDDLCFAAFVPRDQFGQLLHQNGDGRWSYPDQTLSPTFSLEVVTTSPRNSDGRIFVLRADGNGLGSILVPHGTSVVTVDPRNFGGTTVAKRFYGEFGASGCSNAVRAPQDITRPGALLTFDFQ